MWLDSTASFHFKLNVFPSSKVHFFRHFFQTNPFWKVFVKGMPETSHFPLHCTVKLCANTRFKEFWHPGQLRYGPIIPRNLRVAIVYSQFLQIGPTLHDFVSASASYSQFLQILTLSLTVYLRIPSRKIDVADSIQPLSFSVAFWTRSLYLGTFVCNNLLFL